MKCILLLAFATACVHTPDMEPVSTKIPSPDEEDNGLTDRPDVCEGTFTLENELKEDFAVETSLVITLNPDSPEGEVSDGQRTVVSVDVQPVCGSGMVQSAALALSGTDVEKRGWMADILHVRSMVQYGLNGATDTTLGYEVGSGLHEAEYFSYDDFDWVLFRIPFGERFTLTEDDVLTLSLTVPLGPDGVEPAPEDTFHGVMTTFVQWYGLDDPSAYPMAMTSFGELAGHDLRYASE